MTKQITISQLEQEVMEVVWQARTCSARDVQSHLTNKKLAYTTVATVLQRLFDKGLVKRTKESGILVYKPEITKEKYLDKTIGGFFRKILATYGESAIASFAESIESLPKAKRSHLLQLLKNYDHKK